MEALKTLLMLIVGYILICGGVVIVLGWTLGVWLTGVAGESLTFSQMAIGWGMGAVVVFIGLWLTMVAKRMRNRYYNS